MPYRSIQFPTKFYLELLNSNEGGRNRQPLTSVLFWDLNLTLRISCRCPTIVIQLSVPVQSTAIHNKVERLMLRDTDTSEGGLPQPGHRDWFQFGTKYDHNRVPHLGKRPCLTLTWDQLVYNLWERKWNWISKLVPKITESFRSILLFMDLCSSTLSSEYTTEQYWTKNFQV